MDWDQVLAHQEELAVQEQQARAAIVALVQPLTPPPLAAMFPPTGSN